MTSTTPAMSTTFVEAERHGRLYTGGRVRVSTDASFLVCVCGDDTVNVISVASGKLVLAVKAEGDDEFTAVVLHPTEPTIVTASRSRQLRAWALDVPGAACECTKTWKAHKMPVLDLAYDPTGTLVASASADTSAMVFDVEKGFCTHVFRGHEGTVHLVAFHPDPEMLQLVTAAGDNTLRVWDLKSKTCVAQLGSHVGLPTSVAFSADGGTLLTAGRDQLVNTWSWDGFKLVNSIAVLEPLEALAVLPAASKGSAKAGKSAGKEAAVHFVTAGEQGLLRCWDARTGKCVRRQPPLPSAEAIPGLTQLALVGDSLLAVTADHNLVFHAVETLEPGRCVVGNNDEITELRCVEVGSAADEGGAMQLAVATNSEQVRLFSTSDMGCRLLYGHTDVVLALDVSADGEWIASASKDCTARVWGARDAACLAICDGHVEAVGGVAFTKRSPQLLTGSKDKTAKLWDLSALSKGRRADGAPHKPRARASVVAHAKEINAIAVAPNDRLAVTASQDRLAKVWSLKDKEGGLVEAATLKGHKRAIWCVSFSPVDKLVASGSGDMVIKLWSMSDYACMRTLSGHTSSVLKVHWLCKGLQLISSGSDGLVKVWGVKEGEDMCTLDGHDNKVWALDVREGPGGVEAWSGDADSVMVRWTDSTTTTTAADAAVSAEKLEQETELSIAVHAAEYGRAFALALKLRQPRSLRQVLEKLQTVEGGEAQLKTALQACDADALEHCFMCARDWNTTATHALTAHRLLNALFKSISFEVIGKLPRLDETVAALLPYSERHFERLDRLAQSAHFCSYTLAAMRVLVPTPIIDASADASVAAKDAAQDAADAKAAQPAKAKPKRKGTDKAPKAKRNK